MAHCCEKIEKMIGYSFQNRELLRQALTPPSAGLPENNQRLEFLGDSILHLCSTRLVYNTHDDWQEGALSKLRRNIVCTDSLYAWALDLGVVLERGPRSPKKNKTPSPKEFADAVEAMLAAVLLDAERRGKDGFCEALKVVEGRFAETVAKASLDDWKRSDPKTALQEWAATKGLEPPVYELLERSGSDHAPVFSCRARLSGFQAAAKGSTLKRAQAEAARQLIGMVEGIDGESL